MPPEQDELRVSTLELFFDLVFVFTLTQLTARIEHDVTLVTGVQVVLVFIVLFGMYGGYAWLTNQVPASSTPSRLLLIGGMAGFLVCALAVPYAFEDQGLAFGLGFLLVILVHGLLFAHRYHRAVLGFLPVNIATALCLIAAGLVGGTAAYALWVLPIAIQPLTTLLGPRAFAAPASGFVPRPAHFVERHGLLMIVAFGESIVAIGIGLADVHLDARHYAAAVLGLMLAAALWWMYFAGDDEHAKRALTDAPRDRHLRMAVNAYFYAFIPMLLGIVVLAAGIALAIARIDDPASPDVALLLAIGAALYAAGDVLFRRSVGLRPIAGRAVAIPVLLATTLVGVTVSGVAQIGALVAVVVLTLVWESRLASGTPTG